MNGCACGEPGKSSHVFHVHRTSVPVSINATRTRHDYALTKSIITNKVMACHSTLQVFTYGNCETPRKVVQIPVWWSGALETVDVSAEKDARRAADSF